MTASHNDSFSYAHPSGYTLKEDMSGKITVTDKEGIVWVLLPETARVLRDYMHQALHMWYDDVSGAVVFCPSGDKDKSQVLWPNAELFSSGSRPTPADEMLVRIRWRKALERMATPKVGEVWRISLDGVEHTALVCDDHYHSFFRLPHDGACVSVEDIPEDKRTLILNADGSVAQDV